MISDATSVLGLQQEIQRSEESRYDHRLHGVLLVAQGMTCPEVARLLGDAPRSVAYWVHRLDQQGLAGLTEGERHGRPSRLDDKHGKEINRVLRAKPERRGKAGESLGWQDAVCVDRQNLWSPTGRAPMPAVIPAVGVPSTPASSGPSPSRSGPAKEA